MNCPRCGKRINAMDTRCQHCGASVHKGVDSKYGKAVLIVIVALFLLAIFFYVWMSMPEEARSIDTISNHHN